MTAPATPAPAPSADGKSALDRAIEADAKLKIQRFLFHHCGRRGVRGMDAEDAVNETFRVAFQRERDSDPRKHWDQAVEVPELHLARILDNVLKDRRRRALRKPTSPLGEDEQLPSQEPSAELVLVEEERERVLAKAVRDA